MTREFLIQETKKLYAEAAGCDPVDTDESTRAVFGRDVFVWDNVSASELRALRRSLYRIVLAARG